MKIYFLIILFLFSSCNQNEVFFDLENLEWENRLVIVFSDNDEFIQNQLDDLTKYSDEIVDRDLVILFSDNNEFFVSFDGFQSKEMINEVSYEKIFKRFFNNRNSRTLLLGKDGQIKIDTNKFIDSNKIFKEIDQMPMRIEEMKNR